MVQNKSTRAFMLSSALALSAVAAVSSGPAFASPEPHSVSKTQTYNDKKTCRAAHTALETAGRAWADNHCKNVHNSPAGNPARQENYTKNSCTLNRVGGQVDSVTVNGTLTFRCAI